MCGIAGLVYSDANRVCGQDVVTAMRDIASYRGPDDAGNYLEGPVGLGHRRLSIIDLGGGHQPMADVRQRLHIVFNGEIYNYRPLRDELVARGHAFHTHSDTEVILNLYAEMGERCVEKMNGMFAFAIWDAAKRTLFLARDRMGVKPLYYAQTPEAFVFGSEIKSLFASKLVTPRCREEALTEYLFFRQVAGSDTLFHDVKALPPGCTMTVHDGRATISRYWSPRPSAEPLAMTFDDAVAALRALLEDSVRLRLISDVPVGTFCSGGVDSSLVTALAAKQKGDAVNTFSVGFDEEDFDESAYALMVSERYKTVHHQLRVGNAPFSELFPRMVWHNDEPLDFANSVHIFALSELAKRHVTVVLTGEGSDELFAGYPRYRIPGLARSYRHVPAPMRKLIGNVIQDHRLQKLDRYASTEPEDILLFNSSYLRPDVVTGIAPDLPMLDASHRRECLEASAALGLDSVSRASLLDQESFLVSILHRQDKMSMAASIESRVPFMDYRIVEFANRLPTEHKIRRGAGKAIVKQIARDVLPAPIVDRRKSGFGVPLARWFRAGDGMGERIAALPDSPGADVFDRAALRRLVDEHRANRCDHSEVLWTALNLATWRETFDC
ncbi:MAG TPA: asparagine synthase (glutamine-hydrolyzing) [Vicinamibacterales bacterium]|nr:asparagine synthase (glutamine-hydrolyzing) [Vicinamibacterales bacterium]